MPPRVDVWAPSRWTRIASIEIAPLSSGSLPPQAVSSAMARTAMIAATRRWRFGVMVRTVVGIGGSGSLVVMS